jgi:hypothetical protein
MMYSSNMQIFNSKHLVFLATEKWQNLKKIGGFKVCTVHYFKFPLLLFLQYLEYKVSQVEILHVYRIHCCLYQGCFSEFFGTLKCHFQFFETLKCHFQFLKKNKLHVAWSTKWHTRFAIQLSSRGMFFTTKKHTPYVCFPTISPQLNCKALIRTLKLSSIKYLCWCYCTVH